MMNELSSSDLKTILLSKRANVYYLERCRLLVNDGRVEYVTEDGEKSLYWNIPIANTVYILLGTGTSITQNAMRELSRAGVMVGFCGGGGTPLFSGNEFDLEVSWFSPQSEYRPTQYLQNWVRFWFDDGKRLSAAKILQKARVRFLQQHWIKEKHFESQNFYIDVASLNNAIDNFFNDLENITNNSDLLLLEARFTKYLFKLAVNAVRYGDFTRAKRGESTDPANRFLDHGNYLAYGLGASATWVLGIPHAFSVLHGKTRRGGLVFDVADLVKDALILPQSFISAIQGDDEQTFRQKSIRNLMENEALDFMIENLKQIALGMGEL